METPPTEDSQLTPNSSDVAVTQIDPDNFAHQLSASVNGGDESDQKLSAEDVKGVLEIIASTGKFWHDWNELKNMLLFQLKQVLSEYPEARKSDDQQNSSLGESYLQLLRSLEEALYSFIEGPPFTLQRLCEILLNAQTIYPNLSKLALALEKNLLVTSTITKCTDSYPQTVEVTDASMEFVDAEPLLQSHPHDQSQPEPLTEAHYLSQHLESLPQPHHQSQPEPQTHHQSQPEPQPHPESQPQPQQEPQPHHHSQPEPQPQQEPQPHHQSQPEPQHHHQSELEPQPHHSQALDESQPQPQIQIQPECPLPPHSNLEENGGEPMTCDRDEVMSEVDAEVDDGMTIDMETFEEIISTSESTNPQSNNSQS